MFLILSGMGLQGCYCFVYYKALQIGDASKVVPVDKFGIVITMILAFIILKETLTLKIIIGGLLIIIGTFLMIL